MEVLSSCSMISFYLYTMMWRYWSIHNFIAVNHITFNSILCLFDLIYLKRRGCKLLFCLATCIITWRENDSCISRMSVDYLNLCTITLQSRHIAHNNSQCIHSFDIYAIRGILCPLSSAFAKRCPLFDVGSIHKRIDGELPAGLSIGIYACIIIL